MFTNVYSISTWKNNLELKQEVEIEEKAKWKLREATREIKYNTEELYEVYSEIKKLSMLIKCFQQRESVNLVQLLDDNAIIPQNLDLKDTISLANGELQNLKAMTSDVYAEQCGNKCFAQ